MSAKKLLSFSISSYIDVKYTRHFIDITEALNQPTQST